MGDSSYYFKYILREDNMTQGNNAINKLMKKAGNLEVKLSNTINQLSKIVKENGTTGDIIADLVLLRHKTFNRNIVDQYRLLEDKLKGQSGQPIMVIRNVMCNSALSGRGKGKIFGAGVLNGEKFIHKKPNNFCFPVKKKHLHILIYLFERTQKVKFFNVPDLFDNELGNPVVLIGEDEIKSCAMAKENVFERVAVEYFIAGGLFPFTLPSKYSEIES